MNSISKILFFILVPVLLCAQESVAPLGFIDHQNIGKVPVHKKTRSLNLPFVDDFSGDSPYPNPQLWQDFQVYINQGFAKKNPTYGVATFDILNSEGKLYYPTGIPTIFYADSLTSRIIDLSGLTPADSVYLSFYYQPQGNGFKPEGTDSLALYLRGNNQSWVKVWSAGGEPSKDFTQVMIPVTANFYLHNNFQFRFVNKASPNGNDDNWNLDYVYMDKNRSAFDTVLNEVSFTLSPKKIFKEYTAMPYRHLAGFEAIELDTFVAATVANLSTVNRNINVHLNATNSAGTPLHSTLQNTTLLSYVEKTVNYPMYAFSLPANSLNRITHQYYFPAQGGKDIRTNDTVKDINELGAYFAYDDGTAEKSYYLFSAANVPARTALAFHLNVADTIQGLAIKWGTQSPSAEGKPFGIKLYHSLASNTTPDSVIYEQDFYTVQYPNAQNEFAFYKFDTPQFLAPGKYYIGTIQPINSNVDTLYFGLDANTNANQKNLFFNTSLIWEQSQTDGSIMMRPWVGPAVYTPMNIKEIQFNHLTAYPNPVCDRIYLGAEIEYSLYNQSGQLVKSARASSIEMSNYPSGIYYIQAKGYHTKKIIKE